MTMFFGTNLDLSSVKPSGERTEFQPIPAGNYKVICTSFEVQPKDYGLGAKVKFQVLDGEYAGKVIFDHFILTHSVSAQAQQIGQSRLRAWTDALGLPPSLDSAKPLINRPVMAKIKIDKERTVGDKTYNAQNRVETFFAEDSATGAGSAAAPVARPAVVASPAPKAAVATSPATGATPAKAMPWKK